MNIIYFPNNSNRRAFHFHFHLYTQLDVEFFFYTKFSKQIKKKKNKFDKFRPVKNLSNFLLIIISRHSSILLSCSLSWTITGRVIYRYQELQVLTNRKPSQDVFLGRCECVCVCVYTRMQRFSATRVHIGYLDRKIFSIFPRGVVHSICKRVSCISPGLRLLPTAAPARATAKGGGGSEGCTTTGGGRRG